MTFFQSVYSALERMEPAFVEQWKKPIRTMGLAGLLSHGLAVNPAYAAELEVPNLTGLHIPDCDEAITKVTGNLFDGTGFIKVPGEKGNLLGQGKKAPRLDFTNDALADLASVPTEKADKLHTKYPKGLVQGTATNLSAMETRLKACEQQATNTAAVKYEPYRTELHQLRQHFDRQVSDAKHLAGFYKPGLGDEAIKKILKQNKNVAEDASYAANTRSLKDAVVGENRI